MDKQISIVGSDTDLGTLIRVQKERAFAGKKNNRVIYHTRYSAGFFNPENKRIGWYSSEQPVTSIVTTHTIAQMRKFLTEHGYEQWELSQI